MNRTLVVSSSAAGAQLVQELLPARDYSPVVVAGGGAEARRFCAESDFDLVIINAPLSDEFGHDLAVNVASQSAGRRGHFGKKRAGRRGCRKGRNGRGFCHPQAGFPAVFLSGDAAGRRLAPADARPAAGEPQAPDLHRGDPADRPGQMRADPMPFDDRAAGPPLH